MVKKLKIFLFLMIFSVFGFNGVAQTQGLVTSNGGSVSVEPSAPAPTKDVQAMVTAPVYYAIDNNTLYKINKNTYATTVVGPLGVIDDFQGLAYDTRRGILFAIGGQTLYRIDTFTGAATLVGPYGAIAQLYGLTYSPETDRLLASQFVAGGSLYSLNRTTGAATLLGNMGGPKISSLAYVIGYPGVSWNPYGLDAVLGPLYVVGEDGTTTFVGNDGNVSSNAGMAFNTVDNIVLVADFDMNLWSINPATGIKTLVGTSGANITGLAFAPKPAFLRISPATGPLVTTQRFDLVLIAIGGPATLVAAALDGNPVTGPLSACVVPGTLIPPSPTGSTLSCAITGATIGVGSHTFVATVNINGIPVTNSVTWDVYNATQP